MKRIFDIFLAIVLLPFLLFWTAIVLIAIFIIDKFPPFHIQKRVGKNGRLFVCYKLQTMRPAKSQGLIGERELDCARLTKLGEFIRDHGWDEIPQILNVMLGKMSFIGPRPLLPKTLDRIRAKNPDICDLVAGWEKRRSQVRPGISGWHQVQIGHRASMLQCDLEHLKGSSFLRLSEIMYETILVFVLGKKMVGRLGV